MMHKCALCGSEITPEVGPIVLGDDGLPLAAAVCAGLGVPLMEPARSHPDIFCDGVKVDHCVGFDRPNRRAWRFQKIDGSIVFRDGDIVIEMIAGDITLERTKG